MNRRFSSPKPEYSAGWDDVDADADPKKGKKKGGSLEAQRNPDPNVVPHT